jgi:hypothetical protein
MSWHDEIGLHEYFQMITCNRLLSFLLDSIHVWFNKPWHQILYSFLIPKLCNCANKRAPNRAGSFCEAIYHKRYVSYIIYSFSSTESMTMDKPTIPRFINGAKKCQFLSGIIVLNQLIHECIPAALCPPCWPWSFFEGQIVLQWWPLTRGYYSSGWRINRFDLVRIYICLSVHAPSPICNFIFL